MRKGTLFRRGINGVGKVLSTRTGEKQMDEKFQHFSKGGKGNKSDLFFFSKLIEAAQCGSTAEPKCQKVSNRGGRCSI